MGKLQTAFGAVVFAAACLGPQLAQAEVRTIDLSAGSQFYGNVFESGQEGVGFSDTYNFTLSGPSSVSALVSSIAASASDGLEINWFSLRTPGGTVFGSQLDSGRIDSWEVGAQSSNGGLYRLVVSGILVGDGAASYGGNINVTVVPEPATWAMLLAGLALLAGLGRGRPRSRSTEQGSGL